MKKLKWVPTPPMAVALVALFVALSEAGYAAVVLPKNSVGSVQIRDGQVKRADLAGSAVNSGKVADRSLLALEFALGQLPAGPPGSVGPTGPAGPKGDPGAAAFAGQSCPSGESVTGFDSEGDLVCSAAMPVGATSPSISINSPADGKERPSGAAIPFIANASDPEDGTLSGASIVWVDDVDGQIGTGASFSYSYSGSSLGQHQVTATATESDGNTAGATITITIT